MPARELALGWATYPPSVNSIPTAADRRGPLRSCFARVIRYPCRRGLWPRVFHDSTKTGGHRPPLRKTSGIESSVTSH